MIKKVSVNQLKPGMFIHDFNAAWMDENPFPRQMMLSKDEEVQFIVKQGVKEVYIDTRRGSDGEGAGQADVQAELAAQLQELGVGDGEAPGERPVRRKLDSIKSAPLEEELAKAAEAKQQARTLVGNVLEDARLGKQVAVGPVKDAVAGIMDSMFRNEDAMLSLSQLKQRDEYTFLHSVNVGVFLMSFSRAMGDDEETIIDVGTGAMLHDIGKMRTPPEVLNKPGRLTDDEFQIMRDHVVHSYDILSQSPGISESALHVAGQHHERYDGTGYPDGLKGEEIGKYGQMAAIVDVYDAITSDRCYHKGMSPHVALQKMMDWSKHHFNKGLFESFVRCVGIYPIGTMVRLKNGLMGVVIESNRDSLLYPVVNVIIDSIKKRKLRPEVVHLIDHRGKTDGYQIAGREDHRRWGVDPKQFMPEPKLFN
ncbi:MAG: HD-GYP domain-containing protein [Magnetococcales bacterium]|nr:HD-GYP domain-containing protein [Magnetococcales bacterium]